DLFKQLLRAALQAKASVLHIRVDRVPSADSPLGLNDLPCPAVKAQEIMDMINGIAPPETVALLSQGKMRGSLNLGGAGKVNFIGTSANNMPTALLIFFSPDGDKKFEEKWQQLLKAASGQKEQAPPVENALPPEAFAAMAHAKAKAAKSHDPAVVAEPSQNQSQNSVVPSKVDHSIETPATQAVSTLPEIEYTPFSKGEQTVSAGGNELDRYLKEMVKRKASDIHLTGGEPVCFRADGEIVRVPDTMLTPEYMKQLLEPIIPPRNREEFLKINDTDFAYEVTGVGRFRVNIFRDKNGVGSVMRHIPSTILTAEQLKLTPSITNFCKLNKGLVLVTGPTGSGKSTTLAAMIDLINKNRHDHILTVEDPIEFVHSQQKCLVNQREVHRHTTSFARALK
ncbi:MAG: hypothetical protein EBU49_13350, partial [Proteobacteria bacterium]|nr:hypothetical protein [Pseudomonadota bacterium]